MFEEPPKSFPPAIETEQPYGKSFLVGESLGRVGEFLD